MTNVLPGLQLENANGPVPSGVFANVPAVMALVDSMERFTEVKPSRIEVSALLSWNCTL